MVNAPSQTFSQLNRMSAYSSHSNKPGTWHSKLQLFLSVHSYFHQTITSRSLPICKHSNNSPSIITRIHYSFELSTLPVLFTLIHNCTYQSIYSSCFPITFTISSTHPVNTTTTPTSFSPNRLLKSCKHSFTCRPNHKLTCDHYHHIYHNHTCFSIDHYFTAMHISPPPVHLQSLWPNFLTQCNNFLIYKWG